MTRRTLAIGTALFLTFAGVAAAGNGQNDGHQGHHGHHGHRGHRGPPPIEHLTEALGLSDTQAASLKALHESHRDEAEAIHDSLRAQHDALRAAMQDGTSDEAALHALVDEIGVLRLELDHHHLDGQLATRALLTEEQREQLDELGPPPHGRPPGPPPGHHRGPPSDCPPE